MDLLQRMNAVVEYIENNLTEEIGMNSLSRIAGCSSHEFSHIFSFAAGMPISEYIRRRRLSQAVFDIQNGKESLADISLKYGYESQSAFTRAFKELHGQTPAAARKNGVSLKTYPKITFKLIIKGVTEMDFRIEQKESFKIIGYKSGLNWDEWGKFFERFQKKLWEDGYNKAPLWEVWAFNLPPKYNYEPFKEHPECTAIVGAEYNGEPLIEGLDIEEYPAAAWAIFPVVSDPENDATGKKYAQAMTEWIPLSNYERNENLPFLEIYGIPTEPEKVKYDEVWIPVLKK